MTTAIEKYSPTEAALVDLEARYKGIVFIVTTPKGMQDANAAYKDINTHSITLEKVRVAEKAESLAYGRLVDSEAKRIADKLDALRLPIKAMIETETKREQREREARVKAEQDRILTEQAAAKAAEEKRMAEARAEIARQQAEVTAARRAQAEADEADRQARLAREAEEAKVKAIRDAEEARLKAERDRIDAEARAVAEAQRKAQAEADAKARAEREAEEAKRREEQRRQAEIAGGFDMLATFHARYGQQEQFKDIALTIGQWLAINHRAAA